jgi:alkaline phosphatase
MKMPSALVACFLFHAIVAESSEIPKSIILLIADGSGSAHFTTGRMLRGEKFQIGRLPSTGMVSTSPLPDSFVTDSAAAATAYSIGMRTKYRYVGVDAEGEHHQTVLERAEELRKSTGLVTTTNFWDATPAAFAAHTKSRYERDKIIGHMLSSGVDVIAGGGAQQLGTDGGPELEELAEASGYDLIREAGALAAAGSGKLLAVFPTEEQEVDFATVSLPVLAQWALDKVSGDPDGFFLMIEHEGTDGASHANMTDKFIASMLSFDDAVGLAMDYASTRDDVLVIVTSDHETGGLQIHREKGSELELRWATGGHTGEAVPIFSYGPGAENFTGFMDGEDVGKKIMRLLK